MIDVCVEGGGEFRKEVLYESVSQRMSGWTSRRSSGLIPDISRA